MMMIIIIKGIYKAQDRNHGHCVRMMNLFDLYLLLCLASSASCSWYLPDHLPNFTEFTNANMPQTMLTWVSTGFRRIY